MLKQHTEEQILEKAQLILKDLNGEYYKDSSSIKFL
jgi:hypothetical protein